MGLARTAKSKHSNVVDLAAARERFRQRAAAASLPSPDTAASQAPAGWFPVVFVFPVWFGYSVPAGPQW